MTTTIEIRSQISDAAVTSLGDAQAAATLLERINGATPERLLAAAIDLLRDERRRRAEIVADLTADRDIFEDEIVDLKIEIEGLRARKSKASAP